MKIITAADAAYKEMVIGAINMHNQLGYETLVYDLGGLGIGEPFDISDDMDMIRTTHRTLYTGTNMQKGSFKPKIILHAMMTHPNEKWLAWIDADAFAIKQIHWVTYFRHFDIAVTMRRKGEHAGTPHPMWDQYINSGVVIIQNTLAMRKFVMDWIDLVPTTQALSDQEALNVMCDAPKLVEYNKLYNINGYSILNLSTDEYNFYYFPEQPHDDTKVLHFKGVKDTSLQYFREYYKKHYDASKNMSWWGMGVKS